jgi:hypothetical protein
MSGTEVANIRIAKEVERSPQQNQNLSLLGCAAGSKLADYQGFFLLEHALKIRSWIIFSGIHLNFLLAKVVATTESKSVI